MAKYCTTGIVTNYRICKGIIKVNSDLKHNGKNIWIEVDCNDDYKEKCSAIMLCQNQNIIVKGGYYCCFRPELQTAALDGSKLKFYINVNSLVEKPKEKDQTGNSSEKCCCQKCYQSDKNFIYELYDVEIISK